jgi:hypothetical protein
MDYDKFKAEYDKFTKDNLVFGEDLWDVGTKNDGIAGAKGVDTLYFGKPEQVNNPPHYTRGKTEAIEVIADAITDAPYAFEGFLQGQVLKYMLRMWLKDNPTQDAEKAQWYLNKLVDVLNCHD